MTIEERIEEVRKKIIFADIEYLKLLKEEKAGLGLDGIIAELKNVVPDGKKLRSFLLGLGYTIFGGKEEAKIIKAAISMDFLQYAMLIFDDAMDSAVYRHGKFTIHHKIKKLVMKKFKKFGLKIKEAGDYGRSSAELAGLFALECAHDVLSRSEFDPELKIKASLKLNEIIMATIAGQSKDLKMGISPQTKEFSKKFIFEMMEEKTGYYTISGPIQIGAILAGADEESLKSIMKLATIGIAFQMRDDILGIVGDERKTGKSASSDIAEGKRTILILIAKEKASWKRKRAINKALGKKRASREDVEKARNAIIETGAIEECQEMVESLAELSRKELEKMEIEEEHKELLRELINFLTKREY